MVTKTIPWQTGGGNITLTYEEGTSAQPVSISSDPNPLGQERVQTVTFATTEGSPAKEVALTVKQKGTYNEALIDAWIMSGYRNEDVPEDLIGLKGIPMHMNGFAYTEQSGFNTTDYNGALVFDGVDDCCISDSHEEWLQTDFTVIFRCSRVFDESNTNSTFLFSRGEYLNRGFRIYQQYYLNSINYRAGYGNHSTLNNVNRSLKDSEANVWTKRYFNDYDLGDVSSRSLAYKYMCFGAQCDNNNNVPSNFSNYALYYFALYNRTLTAEEITKEKTFLEQEWQKRLDL